MGDRKYIFENPETEERYYFRHHGNGYYTEYNEKGDIIEVDHDDRLLDFILECEEVNVFPWETNEKLCKCDNLDLFRYGCRCKGK